MDENDPRISIEDFNPCLLEPTNKAKFNEVKDEEIKRLEIKKYNEKLEQYEIVDIENLFSNEELATSFLIQKNIFANSVNSKCPKCGSNVKYYMRSERGKYRKMLRCIKNGCQTTLSLRKNNSFFTNMYKDGYHSTILSNKVQLQLIYHWCLETPYKTIASETGRHITTVRHWMHKCQEIPLQIFEKRTKLGGFGKNVFIHYYSFENLQKYKDQLITNCGPVECFNISQDGDKMINSLPKFGSWIFVLCDNNEKRYFFISDAKEEGILSNIIKQEINDNTIIHLHVRNNVNNFLMFTYIPKINHKANYDIFDPNSYTDNMESLWLPLISSYKTHRYITHSHISKYLIELWWRDLNKLDLFNAFLRDLIEIC